MLLAYKFYTDIIIAECKFLKTKDEHLNIRFYRD